MHVIRDQHADTSGIRGEKQFARLGHITIEEICSLNLFAGVCD
jgi:hypothetical protein